MAVPNEALMAGATALLVAGPTLVFWRAWSRARGQRVLLASCAFTAFLATDVVLVLGNLHALPGLGEGASEGVELVGDVVSAALFAAAFLLPTGAHADDL